MSLWIQALKVVLPVAYFVAAFFHAMHFGGELAPRVHSVRRITLVLAVVLHVTLFATLWTAVGSFPAFDAWSTLSSVALGIALLYGATALGRGAIGEGAIVYGTVGLLQMLASAFMPLELPSASGHPLTFNVFHAFTSMAAASALVLSGVNGVLFLVVYRRMKKASFGPLVRGLPSLNTLAILTRRAALGGFLLLSIGINFGIGWAHSQGVAGFGYTDPWVLAMLVLWLHFGLVAFSGRIPGLSAVRASYAATAGLSVFVLASLATLIPHVSFHWGS